MLCLKRNMNPFGPIYFPFKNGSHFIIKVTFLKYTLYAVNWFTLNLIFYAYYRTYNNGYCIAYRTFFSNRLNGDIYLTECMI